MQQRKNMKNSLRMLTANRIYSYKMVNVNVITPASGQKDYAHDMCQWKRRKINLDNANDCGNKRNFISRCGGREGERGKITIIS
jgi:hypothetical protein